MSDPATRWKDTSFYIALAQFIDSYGYVGVQRLCSRFGFDVLPNAIETRCMQPFPSAIDAESFA